MSNNNQSLRQQPIKVNRKRKRGDTTDKVDVGFFDRIQVPLTNRFEALQNGAEKMHTSPHKPKITISPIIVTDHSTNIDEIARQLDIKYRMKILSIGRKVMLDTVDDKKKFYDILVKEKIHFYSHPDIESKVFKVILSGLPQVETGDIIASLRNEHNITPSKVTMFKTESVNKIYLCHFNKSEVDMKRLNTVTTVYHHVIKWSTYKRKRNGPTQCYRCCMYGHGASTCNRYVVCLVCSGNHETKSCSITNESTSASYKCFNCLSANLKHDHKANDLMCPFRAKYEMVRANAREKNNRVSTTQKARQNELQQQKYAIAATPSPLQGTFASVLKSTSAVPTQTQPKPKPVTYNQSQHSTSSSANTESSDLFTIEEVTDILFNSITELQQCASKFDQLRVITNILRNVCK